MNISELNKFLKLLKGKRSFIIASHLNPEGDAIASSLAFAFVLKKMGKRVWIYNRDVFPQQFAYLPHYREVRNTLPRERFEVAIIVDTAKMELLGEEFLDYVKTKVGIIVKIDHHVVNEEFGDIKIIDKDASSTGEVIYRILKRMKYKITPPLADCIYTSIFTDTGGFRFPNATFNSFKIASETVNAGVKPWVIYEHLYDHQSANALKLLGETLSTLEIHSKGRIASIFVTKKMMEETGTTKKDTEGLINFPRSVDGVKIAVMFREDDSKIKVSLRSKGDIDVSKIAEKFGGGGHKGASAFTYEGDLKNTMRVVLKELERHLL